MCVIFFVSRNTTLNWSLRVRCLSPFPFSFSFLLPLCLLECCFSPSLSPFSLSFLLPSPLLCLLTLFPSFSLCFLPLPSSRFRFLSVLSFPVYYLSSDYLTSSSCLPCLCDSFLLFSPYLIFLLYPSVSLLLRLSQTIFTPSYS